MKLGESLRSLIRKLKEPGSFLQDFFSLASGSSIIIVIQVLFTPLLARVFDPTAYGNFSLSKIVISNLVVIGTLGLRHAIIVARHKFQLLSIFRLNLAWIVFWLLVFTILFLWLDEYLISLIRIEDPGLIFYLLPVVATLGAVIEITTSWFIKSGDFKTGPIARVLDNLVSRVASLSYGTLVNNHWFGLLLGFVVGRFTAFVSLVRLKLWKYLKLIVKGFSWQKAVAALKEHQKFVKYNLPTNLISMWGGQVPLFLTTLFISLEYTGYLSFANSLMYVPLNLIGNSLYTVLYQRAGNLGPEEVPAISGMVSKMLDNLVKLGVLPLLFLVGFGDYIFYWFLGENWLQTGQIAQAMGLYYFTFLLYTATSCIFTVLKRQEIILVVQIVHLLLGILVFQIFSGTPDPIHIFLYYGAAGTLVFFGSLVVLHKLLRLPLKGFFLRMLMIFALVAIVLTVRFFW